MLHVINLNVTLGGKPILTNVSFDLEAGQWLMVIGPNGAGKSTLVNAVSGGVPYTGSVTLNGRDLNAYKSRERAAQVGVLSQNHYVGYGFTVEEVIRLGRYAHAPGLFSKEKDRSEEKVALAVERTGMKDYLKRSVLTLSGGEQQRVFLAQLFAQDPRILILDEPANHLDLAYQQQVFSLVRTWLGQEGRAVITVVHDLSLAKMFGTHALLLDQGRIRSQGAIDSVMTPESLGDVYRMDVYEWMQQMYSVWHQ